MYKLNFFKLLDLLLWTVINKPIVKDFLKALMIPLAYLHTFFMQYRRRIAFDVRVNGQVRKLRWGLNQVFDIQLERILVIDATVNITKYVYLNSENKPLYLPTFLGGVAYDFEVHVPIGLKGYEKGIINFVNQYRLPSKRFTIVWI